MSENKANSNKYVRVDTFSGKRILKVDDLLSGAGKQIFLPDVGWIDDNYSNYIPSKYNTQEEIQMFFEQKEIMAEYLQDGMHALFDIDDKLEIIVHAKVYANHYDGDILDEEIELWKAVWLYENIVMNDTESLKQISDYVGNKLIKFRHMWNDIPGISEYQKQLPEKILSSDYNMNELVNICAKLSIEQLYMLGL